jgi:ABC-type transport system substrate-binding protein
LPTSTPFSAGSASNFGLSWPKYNKADAQKLFDAYASAHGGTVNFTIEAFQDSSNTKEGQFFQSALNQYQHVKVQLKVAASSTAIGNVFSGNYQAHTWGAPWYSPSGLYIYLHTGQQLNVYGYSNSAVDKALDAARASGDQATQDSNNRTVVQHMVSDLPFFNYGVRQASVLYTSKVHNVSLFYDAYPFLENIWMG